MDWIGSLYDREDRHRLIREIEKQPFPAVGVLRIDGDGLIGVVNGHIAMSSDVLDKAERDGVHSILPENN